MHRAAPRRAAPREVKIARNGKDGAGLSDPRVSHATTITRSAIRKLSRRHASVCLPTRSLKGKTSSRPRATATRNDAIRGGFRGSMKHGRGRAVCKILIPPARSAEDRQSARSKTDASDLLEEAAVIINLRLICVWRIEARRDLKTPIAPFRSLETSLRSAKSIGDKGKMKISGRGRHRYRHRLLNAGV